MKLYSGMGPNPQVVRMFAAEKGLDIPLVKLDLPAGENRQPAFLAKNPLGQLPALELDDGTVLTEITAICEYLEEIHPSPPLIGTTAAERAETRMWVRRIDLNILEPFITAFRAREGHELFKDRMKLIPQAVDDLRGIVEDNLTWLNTQMAGRDFVCGMRLTLADIMLFCFLRLRVRTGTPIDPAQDWIAGHFARMQERASAKA